VNASTYTDGAARRAVEQYAADVRRSLAGLRPDEVDDLTDGLEADLADALSDGPDLPGPAQSADRAPVDLNARFGDPAAYARELRAAAGLPETGAGGGPARPWPAAVSRVGGRVAAVTRTAAAAARRQPWWHALERAAADLRPLWWVARAWVVYQAVMWLAAQWGWLVRPVLPERDGVPSLARHWALLLVLVVVSLQWGRRRWGAGQIPRLSGVASVVALVLLVPVGVFTYESRFYGSTAGSVRYVEVPVTQPVDDGVWVDGMQVSNLFVYDAAGNPLSGVQVYDDRGRPVRTADGWVPYELPGVSGQWSFVPATDEDGRRRWNVYPLLGAPYEDFDTENPEGLQNPEDVLRTEPRVPPRPFAKAPAVVERDAEQEPTSDATAGGVDQDEGPAQNPAAPPATSTTGGP
jgi:hypothetical protein